MGLVTVVQAAAPSGFAILPRQPSGTYFPRWVELITLAFGDWDSLMRHHVRSTKYSWQPGCMLPHERCGWMPKLITPWLGITVVHQQIVLPTRLCPRQIPRTA